jgi:hypothetical protein
MRVFMTDLYALISPVLCVCVSSRSLFCPQRGGGVVASSPVKTRILLAPVLLPSHAQHRLCPGVVLEGAQIIQAFSSGESSSSSSPSGRDRSGTLETIPPPSRHWGRDWHATPVSIIYELRHSTRLGLSPRSSCYIRPSATLTLSRSLAPQPAVAGATKSYSTPAKPATPEIPDAGALAKELESYDS